MAAPVDVVAGEVIEVEWGNDIRDWAVSSVEFNLAAESSSTATTSSFVSAASVTFTKPSLWVAYTIMAWGAVTAHATNASGMTLQVVVDIGGTDGSPVNALTTVNGAGVSAPGNCRRTGQTGNSVVAIQFRHVAGGGQKSSSTVNYLAFRTS